MSSDPRHNVRPGDKLRIAAEQINFLNGLMRPDTGFNGQALKGYEPGRNIIFARNNTGNDVARWGVMQISGIEINPTSGDNQRRSFEEMPCIIGATPDATTDGRFVIAVEPIKSGKIGRACVAGVVQAKVHFANANHKRAKAKANNVARLESAKFGAAEILWSAGTSGEQWALVRVGAGDGSDQMRIGKTNSAWNKGALATISIYEAGTPPNETSSGETLADCVNKFANVASGRWVAVSKAGNGSWYLIAAEC